MSFEYEVVKAAGTDAPALNTASPTKIKVVGCGGCGGNAVNTMIESGVGGVEFIAMNTDLQALSQNKAQYKIQIGQKLAGGLGAGGKPEVGEESAKEQQEQIKELLKDSDMVFITAGMGGGTGTGSAPVVAKIARDLGALTVAVVTTPFKFEGKVRMAHAEEGVRKLREEVDSLIAIPNELILKDAEKRLSVPMAFTLINDILRQGVQGISDIITKPGLVNRDFRDVESVMKGQGDAILGIGVGEGDNRAVDAAHNAINNRLLVDTNIDGAKNVLINICGNNDVGIAECNEIAQIITERANPDAVVLWGQVLDESMEDKISVTVIATGFNKTMAAEKTPEIQKVEEQINSDTMSIDNFVKIGTRKAPIETAASQEPKKNEFMSNIFGNDEIYEDDKNHSSSAKSASASSSFMHEEKSVEKKDFISDFTRSAQTQPKAQPSSSQLTPPAGFSGRDDYEQPAIWRRNLEGLSRGISIGKN
ncbi:MAG: cell division protein FtsZ [Treponema sp.]|uniref:cell division protein FtsZ n=1 Tax=Treponema sp. TaxID=166 RepID=UPI002A918270|nr:cell division protein FtsZ [Treponema sp.]MDY6396890.1 cell division protein FtsZ [Treponema sp.]